MNNKRRLFFGLLISFVIFILFFIFVPKTKAAVGDHIVINEIYSHVVSGDPNDKEWIELYNPTPNDFNLIGWTIKDGSTSFENLDSYVIEAKNYLVLIKGTDFSFALNDGGDTLILKNGVDVIDQLTYGNWSDNQDNQPPAPTTGKSLSRIPNGFDSDDNEKDFRILAPSKGTENFLPVYSNKIIINEIVPQPATGSVDEYIEIYNSGNGEIDLSGWQLDDAIGGSSPYNIPAGTKISTGGYLVFYKSINDISLTGISLNDSGDWARLIDPNGDVKSEVSYSKSIRGQSYSKFSGGWQWTTISTPNVANILAVEIQIPDQDTPILQTDIIGARNQPDGETVSVMGIVSVLPGALSSQYFYIQDGNSGVQIYNYNKDFPAMAIGDEIQVTGELSEYKNEKRLKITSASDIVIISNKSPPEAIQTKIDDLNENFEGRYVVVRGTVSKTSGNTFYIHGSGEIQVIIREGTGIQKPKMRVGDTVEIAGILSQYGDYYRILPIVQSDVKIIKSSSGLPKSGAEIWSYFVLTIAATILWYIFPKVLGKLKN